MPDKINILDGVDGRTSAAKRFKKLVSAFVADLGGADHLNEAQRQLVRRAAAAAVRLESAEAAVIAGQPIVSEEWTREANLLNRVLGALGFTAQPGANVNVGVQVNTGQQDEDFALATLVRDEISWWQSRAEQLAQGEPPDRDTLAAIERMRAGEPFPTVAGDVSLSELTEPQRDAILRAVAVVERLVKGGAAIDAEPVAVEELPPPEPEQPEQPEPAPEPEQPKTSRIKRLFLGAPAPTEKPQPRKQEPLTREQRLRHGLANDGRWSAFEGGDFNSFARGPSSEET